MSDGRTTSARESARRDVAGSRWPRRRASMRPPSSLTRDDERRAAARRRPVDPTTTVDHRRPRATTTTTTLRAAAGARSAARRSLRRRADRRRSARSRSRRSASTHTIYEGIWLTVLDDGPGPLAGQRAAGPARQHRVPRATGSRTAIRSSTSTSSRPATRSSSTCPTPTHIYAVRETIDRRADRHVGRRPDRDAHGHARSRVIRSTARPQRIVVKGDLVATTPQANGQEQAS